jgi:uncharacterized damage-inducible protein DinB
MITAGYARLLAAYNTWMNGRLYAAAAGLSDAERNRDLGAFFGSLQATLGHVLAVDQAWMGRFREGTPRTVDLVDRSRDFAALVDARVALDAEIEEWAAGLDEDWLARDLDVVSNVDGVRRVLPAWIFVVHMFNHQIHHRGQATTLLKQLGIDPGVTDLPWLPLLAG